MPSFDFKTDETKILETMFKETIKQFANARGVQKQGLEVMENMYAKIKKYKGSKINFTQQEHQFLKKSMEESITQTKKQMETTWFGKRWLMKLMLKQYQGILMKINTAK
jgi:primase-polymerase (primpol)-like protein